MLALVLGLPLALGSRPSYAQPFARPPGDPGEPSPSGYRDDSYSSSSWRREHLSWFRLHIGGAGRTYSDRVTPGVMAALDFGRGPAGFRASGAWLRVGSEDGVAQYTGELTLDAGGRSRWRPVLGAGAGLARTYRVDDTGTRTGGGSSIGVGLLRVALEYRLPLEDVDARAGVHLVGTLPAIRGEGAPDLAAWMIGAATVGVGF